MIDHSYTWGADEFGLAGFNCKVNVHTDGECDNHVVFDSDMDEGPDTPNLLQGAIEIWWEENWEHYLAQREADAENTRDDAEYHKDI